MDGVDILKLDCEGGEFDFLECISNDKLSKIKLIICEWHVQEKFWDRYNLLHNKILDSGFSVYYPNEVYKEKSLQNKDEGIFVCFYENENIKYEEIFKNCNKKEPSCACPS